MLYVVTYDITNNKRRQKVLNLLRSYGVSVQLSVVECELDSARLAQLRKRMGALLNPRHDRTTGSPSIRYARAARRTWSAWALT